MLPGLLEDISKFSGMIEKVVLTHNIQNRGFAVDSDLDINIVNINNSHPKGFGANHNQAFKHCDTDYYCVLNPDIRLTNNPFPKLVECLRNSRATIAAPRVFDSKGIKQDTVRYFPTPYALIKKTLFGFKNEYPDSGNDHIYPDWAAGMFLLITADDYRSLHGFDESYYLYYEDVDLSLRSWKNAHGVIQCANAHAIHDAQRESHRNLKFLYWHLKSATKFFARHLGRFPTRP